MEEKLALTSLFGFAVGDAFGVPVEFKSRAYVKAMDIQDMIGYGTHDVPPGAWSDDTSMLISSMDSIARNNGEIIDRDIMDSFMEWLMGSKYLSVDFTFGVGGVIEKALYRYVRGFPISKCGCTGYFENGNGSLMRILPFSLYCIYLNLDQETTRQIIDQASAYTHAHDISKMACFMYTEFLRNLTVTRNPKLALHAMQQTDHSACYSQRAIKAYERLLAPDFVFTNEDDLKESGYVVDTLESVIYSLINSQDYESAVKTAVNLGYDTDTVAGITGSLAAVIYGIDSIPESWLDVLLKRDYLTDLAVKFGKVMMEKRRRVWR